MDIEILHEKFLQCRGVSTDTRKITEGCMFFALRGAHFDANAFAAEAVEKGAAVVVIDNADYAIGGRTLLVPDCLAALQALATFHRDYLGLPIIALTGSNGKTTTKELIHAVLSKKYVTSATLGNLNNHIGVPLTLLSFTDKTEMGIVEMGANHQKEIAFLCGIAKPDFGYITNFGRAHLEGFGGVEGVIKGKSEMYDYLGQAKRMVFVNLDDPIQQERTRDIKRYTFARRQPADVVISEVSADPFVRIVFDHTEVQSQLIGLYNAHNISAAAAIGRFFDIANADIRAALESYVPANNRSQLLKKGGNDVILDAYNANPSSVAVALDHFIQMTASNKVAILGDMFELGAESLAEHLAVVAKMAPHEDIRMIFIGKDYYINRQDFPHMEFYPTFEEFARRLERSPIHNSSLLIKGSRGMALERTLDFL